MTKLFDLDRIASLDLNTRLELARQVLQLPAHLNLSMTSSALIDVIRISELVLTLDPQRARAFADSYNYLNSGGLTITRYLKSVKKDALAGKPPAVHRDNFTHQTVTMLLLPLLIRDDLDL